MEKKYKVIYADPPWGFKVYSDKGKGRSAEAHYACMDLNGIKEMRGLIDNLADKDCVLLLWVTDPFLEKAFSVLYAWGFTYKTVGFYWAKTSVSVAADRYSTKHDFPIGTGYWTRANPEQCLLATRGHPKRINADVRKLIISPRREHSRKPDEIYNRIERLCEGPYIELFARNQHEGWDCWGDQAETGITPRRWSSS